MFIVEVVVNAPVTANVLPSKVRLPSPLNASVPVAVNTLLSAQLDIKSDTSTLIVVLDISIPVPAVSSVASNCV